MNGNCGQKHHVSCTIKWIVDWQQVSCDWCASKGLIGVDTEDQKLSHGLFLSAFISDHGINSLNRSSHCFTHSSITVSTCSSFANILNLI